MFTKVLLALDGSPEAMSAIPYAVDMLDAEGEIDVIHVRELMIGRGGKQTLHADESEVEDIVRSAVATLKAQGVRVTLQFATTSSASPAHAIAEAARLANSDVVVMGTRGRGQVVGLLLGSVTQRLLHIAHCPVLAVPPGAIRAQPVAETAEPARV